MSINKQKNFLFLLFLLINKFIFVSGGIEQRNNVTNNVTIIGIGDILDNIGDGQNDEEEHVSDPNNEEEHVSDLNNEEEHVSVPNNEEEHVSVPNNEEENDNDKNDEEENISDKKDEEENISDKNDEEENVNDKNDEEEHVSDTKDEKAQVSDTNDEKAQVSDTNNEKAQISDTNNEKVEVSDTNNEENIDIKLENYQSCEDIQPTNGIIEDCTSYSYNNEQSCCYVSINYKYNEFNICIKIRKDKKTIERRIEQLENNYEGCDSVDIDCHSKFINFSFIFLLFVLFL